MEYTRFILNNVSIFKNLTSLEQTNTSTELRCVSKKEKEEKQAEKFKWVYEPSTLKYDFILNIVFRTNNYENLY